MQVEKKHWRKKPQDVTRLQLPNYLIKQNLFIRICQHLLIVITVIHSYIYQRTKPLLKAAVPQFINLRTKPLQQQSHNFKLFCNVHLLSAQFISLFYVLYFIVYISFKLSIFFSHFLHCHPNIFLHFSFKPSLNCHVAGYLATLNKVLIKSEGLQVGVS